MSQTALQRNIKRKIKVGTHKIFVQCKPGFEKELCTEINRITPEISDLKEVIGGVELKASLDQIYSLNLSMQTAIRILLRIDKIYALHFNDLYNHILEIPWELYLKQDVPISFKVSIAKSKLHHTVRIQDDFKKAITYRLNQNKAIKSTTLPLHAQMIHIRAIKDIFYISLDSSGDALYKRGFKTDISSAPLRENIAAAILMRAHLETYDTLIDPMCGSGTFSLEALLFSLPQLPNAQRNFAFEQWPVFKQNHYEYIKNNFKTLTHDITIFPSDIDSAAVKISQTNVIKISSNHAPTVKNTDFFRLKESDFPGNKKLLVINPPYGKRIEVHNPQLFYQKIIEHRTVSFTNCDLVLIIPAGIYTKLVLPKHTSSKLLQGKIETTIVQINNYSV